MQWLLAPRELRYIGARVEVISSGCWYSGSIMQINTNTVTVLFDQDFVTYKVVPTVTKKRFWPWEKDVVENTYHKQSAKIVEVSSSFVRLLEK